MARRFLSRIYNHLLLINMALILSIFLLDVLAHDADFECRKIGSQVLALLAKTYTEVHQDVFDLRR